MIKEQINVERLFAHFKRDLATDKGKAPAEFEQKIAEMGGQSTLQLTSPRTGYQSQEVELTGTFEYLFGQIGPFGGTVLVKFVMALPGRALGRPDTCYQSAAPGPHPRVLSRRVPIAHAVMRQSAARLH
jgi:hypothetical protein